MFELERFQAELQTRQWGRSVHYLPRCASTNDIARRDAEVGRPQGHLVLTDDQYEGRGRFRRSWISVPGKGLTFSLLVRSWPADRISLLPLALGIATARCLGAHSCPATLKWPNDVRVRGKKIAGILCETTWHHPDQPATTIAGIGINVNENREEYPVALRSVVTSVRMVLGRPVSREALLARLLLEIESILDTGSNPDWDRLRKDWISFCDHVDAKVQIDNGQERISGYFTGIDGTGSARLQTANGERTVSSGILRVVKRL
ncbi:MAG: biotin--[acetyl-CoA-carboxylase] ligase [Candidatus Neomarinimicrobiota bacterium]|nr:MAG: biotin--[acetyl-CoA-carboxylase] ligase [Candidatus Neomarinimicrobiota bacterium]